MKDRMRIRNMFLGACLGDALGVPYEFKSREEMKLKPAIDMTGFGAYNQPRGTWSDDSSLSFCLAESLSLNYNLQDIALKFVKWVNAEIWTPHGHVFDIGIQTRQSIGSLKKIIDSKDYEALELLRYETDEYTNGNGSLMRIYPLFFEVYGRNTEEQFYTIWNVSALTHGHIRSAIACLIYLKFIEYMFDENDIMTSYKLTKESILKFFNEREISDYEQEKFNRILKGEIHTLSEEDIKSSGYVIHSLEASLWCLLTSKSYKEAVFKAINLGDDTDTTAAITGSLAGICFGLNDVSEDWINSLARLEDIEALINSFIDKYIS